MEEVNEVEMLRKFKEDSGWSFAKISGLMGMNTQSLINWFNGTFKPSRLARDRIRKFLGEYSYKGRV